MPFVPGYGTAVSMAFWTAPAEHLALRDLDAGRLARRERVGGVPDHGPGGVEVGRGVRDVEPERLRLRQRLAERLAVGRVRLRDVECVLRHPGVPHAVRRVGRTAPLLDVGEPLALLAEQVLVGHPEAVERDIGVTDAVVGPAHVRDVPHHLDVASESVNRGIVPHVEAGTDSNDACRSHGLRSPGGRAVGPQYAGSGRAIATVRGQPFWFGLPPYRTR